jgi:hypothetical protein
LIEVLAKLVAKIGADRSNRLIEGAGRWNSSQGDFRDGEETTQCFIALYDLCYRRRAAGMITVLLFLDFRKAFDTCQQILLLYKLWEIGLRGKILFLFLGFYRNATYRSVGD